jgi:membrane-associated phospholipid phosphatase
MTSQSEQANTIAAGGRRLVARGIQVAAFVIMGLIAISRVRLGVHWPSDVVGGLLFGLAAVCMIQAVLLTWRRAQIRR